MNIDGIWQEVILDDYFPCKKNELIFSYSHQNEMWVLLIEKCFAKINGTYSNIENGDSCEVL